MVSIIIPCYNVQETICTTLSSVMSQSDIDFEVIAVDDGSSDATLEIIKKISLEDNRIHIISKSNAGVSSARNVGLAIARGDYILFLDGDDTIAKTLVEEINKWKYSDCDLIMYGFLYEKNATKKRLCRVYTIENYLKAYLLGEQYIHVSSIVVRRDFLLSNNIKFDEQTFYAEDSEYIINCLWYAKKTVIVDKILFCYRWRESSAMHTLCYTEKRSTSLNAMERTYFLLKGTNNESAALTNLKITILLHWKLFYDSCCVDELLFAKLKHYSNLYIYKSSSLLMNRRSLFSFLVGWLYFFKPFFKLFLRLI